VLDLSSHQHEGPSPGKEAQPSGSSRQCEIGKPVGIAGGRDRLHRERGSNVRARVEKEAAVRGPDGIECVVLNQRHRRTVQRDAEEMWRAADLCRHDNRTSVRSPCWRALQVERRRQRARGCAIGVHHV
jgi:hypothetical protein